MGILTVNYKNAKKLKNGNPYRFYSDDTDSRYIHGAFRNNTEWLLISHNKDGVARSYSDEFNLYIPQLTNLKVDDKVIVWDDVLKEKERRYFAGIDDYGRILTFGCGGATSWSSTRTVSWDNWELPEGE